MVVASMTEPDDAQDELLATIENAIRKHFRSIGSSAVVSSDGIERVYYSGFSLEKLAETIAEVLRPAPVTQCKAEPVADRVIYPKGAEFDVLERAVAEPGPMLYLQGHGAVFWAEEKQTRLVYATPPSRLDAVNAGLPKPETMLTYASILEKPQYWIDPKTGQKYQLATGEIVEAACAALRYCAAIVPPPSEAGSADVRAKLYELLRLFRDDYLSADETISGILQDAAVLVPPPSEAGREEKYLTILHSHFVEMLAERYRNGEAVDIAELCDTKLDRSGRLLGEVRAAALSPDPGTVAVASGQRNTDATPANRSTAKATAIVGDDRESMETQPTKVASPEAGSPSISSTDGNTP